MGVGSEAAGHAMAVMAAASLLVSVALVPGLRRSRSPAGAGYSDASASLRVCEGRITATALSPSGR